RSGSTRRTRTCGGRKRVLLLLSYSPAARRVIRSERAERSRREGSVGAYEKRILRACGAQDDRPLASRKRRKRGCGCPTARARWPEETPGPTPPQCPPAASTGRVGRH